MYEIEIKFRVEALQRVLSKLASMGCVLGPSHNHIDAVFARNIDSFSAFLDSNDTYVRIRKDQNRRTTLTVKKPARRDMLVKQEIEVDVDDAQKAQSIIEMLGFKKAATVVKTRRTTKYGEILICIDEVNNLGTFVELEIMGDTNDRLSRSKLYRLARKLGLQKQDELLEGYDILQMRQESRVV